MRRADQNKVSALQTRSPSRKSVAKVAARHPRPALLHSSARRKATGEHSSPGTGAVDRERATTNTINNDFAFLFVLFQLGINSKLKQFGVPV